MHAPDAITPVALGRSPAAGPTEAERTRIRTLAAEFESMLIAQMLRGMKEAMAPESDEGGLGGALMGDTITTELSLALGRSGGLGLSELLSTAMARLDAAAAVPRSAVSVPVMPPVTPAAEPVGQVESDHVTHTDAAAPRSGHGHAHTVTSAFGWRADPFHGGQRFHGGTDMRAAYGQPILAATAGVVTAADERPGYGLVVTVDHGHGLETRYAHLSSTTVQVGSRVQAGDEIARAGASGRATAPHLHFEVRQGGRPVDPAQVAGLGPVVG